MVHPTRRLEDDKFTTRSTKPSRIEAMEKDDTELQLEKILFGDEAGFLDALSTPASHGRIIPAHKAKGNVGDTEVDVEHEDIEEDVDEELFFLDAGQTALPDKITRDLQQVSKEEDKDNEHRQAAWFDSDDERITISLASNTRLRKLRETEEDDIVSGTEYIRRLRMQYERLHPVPAWVKYARKKRKLSSEDVASISDSDISMDDDMSTPPVQPLSDLLRTMGGLTRSETGSIDAARQRRLRPEVLDIQRVKDVTGSGPSSIDTMQFHPQLPLLMTGGPSSTLSLYHVSPQPPNPNPLITSLHLKGTPLHTAAFCQSTEFSRQVNQAKDDTRIFMSSRRRYFHTWSLADGKIQKVSRPIYGSGRHDSKTMEAFKLSPNGNFVGVVGSGKKGGGTVNVLSTETTQWICACRIDSGGGIADFSWWRDSDGFAAIGKNGEVSEYSVEQKKVVYRWLDEGAVGTTTIAVGGQSVRPDLGGNRWVAVGSSSGIVNVYDRKEWVEGVEGTAITAQRPSPTRTFDQLTTPTSYLEFSNDGQMMVMGSRWKKNALRLVHLPSCTIYRNWPTGKTPLGRISSVALSMDGGYLAVANEQGKVRLFQIRE